MYWSFDNSGESDWGAASHYYHKSFKVKDSEMVPPGKMKISPNQLYTAGLGSCCALGFTDGRQSFLAHIDTRVQPSVLAESIRQNFKVEELKTDKSFSVILWRGTLALNQRPQNIAKEVLKELGWSSKLIDLTDEDSVGPMTEVGVDTKGTFCEELKALNQCKQG